MSATRPSFLGYRRSLVQVVAVRLQQAEIWYGNQVRSNSSVDPEQGQTALLLDLMVAEGTIIRPMVRRKVLNTLIEWHQTGPHQRLQFDEKAADFVGRQLLNYNQLSENETTCLRIQNHLKLAVYETVVRFYVMANKWTYNTPLHYYCMQLALYSLPI
jgi:hypothetical protein